MIQIHFSRVLKQVVELTIENQQLNAKGWWCHHRHVKSADVICNDDVILKAKSFVNPIQKRLSDLPHLLKHADLIIDHEKGFCRDQLLDSVKVLLKFRSRLDLDVPAKVFTEETHRYIICHQYYSIIMICRKSKESRLIITLSGFMEEVPWLAHKVVNLANLTKGILGQEG